MSSAEDMELPARAEALLADHPVAERDWEAMAARTVERALGAEAVVAENLLAAPLPPEEGEVGFERKDAPVAKAVAPVSLAELARASVKKKNDANKDIALESLAVASQARAQVDEIAERVQAATRQARGSSPDTAELKPAEPRATAVEAPAAVASPQAPAPAPTPAPVARTPAPVSRGPWIVSGIAVLAAAAAIALALRPRDDGPAPLVVNLPAAATPVTASAVAAQPGELAAAPEPPPASPSPAGEAAPPPPAAAPLGAGAPKAVAAATPSAAPSGVKPEAIVLEDEEEPAAPAPAAAPPPASAKMVPAELPRGGLPDKPSAGAAYAAIGPFMGAARACVAGHDDPSTARIVFASDGSVQSVSVSGPAAGTPAAACIENAFKKARVQPFAAPTFSMSAPVRPQ